MTEMSKQNQYEVNRIIREAKSRVDLSGHNQEYLGYIIEAICWMLHEDKINIGKKRYLLRKALRQVEKQCHH
jgi:hypothetical protein